MVKSALVKNGQKQLKEILIKRKPMLLEAFHTVDKVMEHGMSTVFFYLVIRFLLEKYYKRTNSFCNMVVVLFVHYDIVTNVTKEYERIHYMNAFII